jgi:hypothetical protein
MAIHRHLRQGDWQRFTHGPVDVNHDGRLDILDRAGWWSDPR